CGWRDARKAQTLAQRCGAGLRVRRLPIARVVGCGQISMEEANESTPFGNGIEIPVVVGSGGRDVLAHAELDLNEACQVAAKRDCAETQAQHKDHVRAYCESVRLGWNVIESHCRVESCAFLSNVFLGAHAIIRDAYMVNTTVLSNAEEQSRVQAGADVRDALLQWSVTVDSQSIVRNSLMCTQSHAEMHGKLLDSVLGPYSGVAEGEISESLVGPFVGFHHQSLLIASFWPAGRGNIGYGANVGSNHTGKAPDQELWHGEGVFYGLGSCVKFPSDFSRAPYTLVATGITTLAQRMTCPFSLISSPQAHHGVQVASPAYNEIHPGWVLSQNLYSVIRNEYKFRDRGAKSKRVHIEFEILRPSTVALLRVARDDLARVHTRKAVYTDRDFACIGKNIMTERSRAEAVSTYTRFILKFAAERLVSRLEKTPDMALGVAEILRDISSSATTPSTYEEVEPMFDVTFTGAMASPTALPDDWEHAKFILLNEAPSVVGIPKPELSQWHGVARVLTWLRDTRDPWLPCRARLGRNG
ncbi:Uncharacterized protein TP_0851, partial [Durusdinium trenchii]